MVEVILSKYSDLLPGPILVKVAAMVIKIVMADIDGAEKVDESDENLVVVVMTTATVVVVAVVEGEE